MIALYLLASHMVGDFVFQTRWQAAGKFTDPWLRMRHVWTYALAFLPVIAVIDLPQRRGAGFVVSLVVLHFLTDSRRFWSTLGDWVAWRTFSSKRRVKEWASGSYLDTYGKTSDCLPPNPWSGVPIMVDQSLHLVQLAVLGGLFLS